MRERRLGEGASRRAGVGRVRKAAFSASAPSIECGNCQEWQAAVLLIV